MARRSIKNFIRTAVAGMRWPTAFDVGRAQDINIFAESRDEPLAWLLPVSFTAVPIGESNRLLLTWSCEVFFFKKDEISGTNAASEDIIDDCSERAINFLIELLNVGQDASNTYPQFQVNTISGAPIHKFTTKVFSGVSVPFQIVAPDDFDYCDPC